MDRKKCQIQVTHQIDEMYHQARRVVARSGFRFRVRGGRLVLLSRAGDVREAKVNDVWRAMSRGADWMRDGKLVPPPKSIAQMVLDNPPASVPELTAVSFVPVIMPDGQIMTKPTKESVFVVSTTLFPAGPGCPSKSDAAGALAVLAEPFKEFAFATPADRSSLLAMILTGLALYAFAGWVPAFAVLAMMPGSGKTLLIDLVEMILLGRVSKRRGRPDERQRLFAALASMSPVVAFDNVDRPIGGEEVDRLITGGGGSERGFYTQEERDRPWRGVLIMNGNNLRFKRDDDVRRFVTINLGMPLATFERGEANLRAFVEMARPQLVEAGLTVLRAYILANPSWRESHRDLSQFIGFDGWSSLVRGCLAWLGQVDPLAGRAERLQRHRPVDEEPILDAHEEWFRCFGARWVFPHEIVIKSAEDIQLREALELLLGKPVSTKALGYGLRSVHVRDRIVNRRRFESHRKRSQGGRQWRVIYVDNAVSAESASASVTAPEPTVGEDVVSS